MKKVNGIVLPSALGAALLASLAGAVEPARETTPNKSGPVQLLTVSWLGGPFDDEIMAVAFAPDGTLILAGNGAGLPFDRTRAALIGPAGTFDKEAAPPPTDPMKTNRPRWQHPSTHGFLVRLSPDGQKILGYTHFGHGMATIRKMALDARGNIFLLADSGQGIDLGDGKADKGSFVAALTPDGSRMRWYIRHPGVLDFGLDGNGEVVVLTKAKMTRYAADGKTQKWTVTWKAHGDNRPGAMTVSPESGVAAVTGYGMTHTGKEPYKDPYGYGFDRAGKLLWSLWNPDPRKEKGIKFSTDELKTNGLMADTTGRAASSEGNGKICFMLFADGGNTVCTRDPLDVDRPLDKGVFADVFQNSPGYGFKGASRSSVVFRIDARTGKLEKGTWMTAWLDRAHANALSLDAAARDEQGRQFLVGNSAYGCPTREPWYVCKEGGYKGGGFLAVLDADFKMLQCGYFPASQIGCVSARGGYVAIAGNARHYEDEKSKTEVRVFKPLQKQFGGGNKDGYFAIFKVGMP